MSAHYDVQALPAGATEHPSRLRPSVGAPQLGQVAGVFGVVLACTGTWNCSMPPPLPEQAALHRRRRAGRPVPPDFSGLSGLDSPLIDTLAMSIASTAIAVGVLAGGGLRCSACMYGATRRVPVLPGCCSMPAVGARS